MINEQLLPNEGLSGYSLSVHPNPTTGIIKIISNKTIDKVFIYDYVGDLIKELKYEKEVNISEFASGVYFLGIQSEGIFAKIKIVKE